MIGSPLRTNTPGAASRRAPRVVIHEPARLRFKYETVTVAGCLLNIGLGGAFVRCTTPIEVGRELDCALMLTSRGQRQLIGCRGQVQWIASGEVRRSMGPGFGMRFTQLREGMEGLLRALIEQRTS